MVAPMQFEFQFRAGPGAQKLEPEQAMKILVMGDFSAHNSERSPLAARRCRKVDLDNFEQVLAACAPVLHLDLPELGQSGLRLEFRSLDDFSPDHLYLNLPLFQSLRQTRQELQNTATYAAAVARLRGVVPEVADSGKAAAQVTPAAATDDFSALLGGSIGNRREAAGQAGNSIEALIKKVAAPLIVAGHDPMQGQYLAALDDACSSLMRAILHHPAFQALEAAWRGLYFMITNLDLDQDLQLHLLDCSRADLLADLQAAQGDLSRSALYQHWVQVPRQAADGTPWAALLGVYNFDAGQDAVVLLAALGALAQQAGAPFLAGADTSILGCSHPGQDSAEWQPNADALALWQALRSTSQAAWLGLALPHILLRLPYGRGGEAVEQFAFEENAQADADFLWGNAGFASALLLAQAFREDGWEMKPGSVQEIGDLPAWTYKVDGESHLMPVARAYLSERAAAQFQQAGLMVLQSYKNRNALRLLRMQALALPARALPGPWATSR